MAWHPHKEILAIANRNHDVYIYEREKSQWTCKVLKHKFMIDITALAWKPKAGGTLAVGCRYGVCVWNFTAESAPLQSPQKGVQIKSASSSTMRYHPNAWMKYLRTDGHEHIASLTWDPSPGSHLLAAVSANNSTLMIYDTLTLTGTPLKRYGKGNLLVRWSPDGDWLYVATSTGSIRIWETEHWTSTTYTNPPGLWVQAACWAPDSRSLFYSMRGKSDVHLLYRSGPSINAGNTGTVVWEARNHGH
ncbi:WD40-repeat-containing domain protein [Radiomyces spectabilis]|uniref:WD40-repeat-containing domain protein n=1 Tax=Radiomyces spectabilis TaxID=64574 RepID=UPI002220EC4C|nr:WD40-repeat-containing domain protein [Radiomyces spectabilis]KAI8365194.1 WD40-repeat-containing domain protein [Radiomyces spectabilis]